MEDLDPFHLIDPLLEESSNESIDPSNDNLNVQNAEYFATHYDERRER